MRACSGAWAAIYAIYKQPSPTRKTDGCQYLVDLWSAADGAPEARPKSLNLLALPRGIEPCFSLERAVTKARHCLDRSPMSNWINRLNIYNPLLFADIR